MEESGSGGPETSGSSFRGGFGLRTSGMVLTLYLGTTSTVGGSRGWDGGVFLLLALNLFTGAVGSFFLDPCEGAR